MMEEAVNATVVNATKTLSSDDGNEDSAACAAYFSQTTICWLIGGVVFLAIAGFCCGQFGRTGPGRNSTSSESGTGTLLGILSAIAVADRHCC